jgi:hypothetical protein
MGTARDQNRKEGFQITQVVVSTMQVIVSTLELLVFQYHKETIEAFLPTTREDTITLRLNTTLLMITIILINLTIILMDTNHTIILMLMDILVLHTLVQDLMATLTTDPMERDTRNTTSVLMANLTLLPILTHTEIVIDDSWS